MTSSLEPATLRRTITSSLVRLNHGRKMDHEEPHQAPKQELSFQELMELDYPVGDDGRELYSTPEATPGRFILGSPTSLLLLLSLIFLPRVSNRARLALTLPKSSYSRLLTTTL
ncbi:hypothetical protein ACRALDRAFT_2033779 [Sodiomyces alcalophilus JCM 7366]|uniref:uncharacterized protein n=1 Tax=Sodiomyces alcalophilus JCM 7366 TaxID=591952 RepID=UPI0039B68D81